MPLEERSIAEVMNNYFVDVSKSLNLKDSSESNADNTSSNIRLSFKNVLFEDHVSGQIMREENTDNGKFRYHPISTEEQKQPPGVFCKKRSS